MKRLYFICLFLIILLQLRCAQSAKEVLSSENVSYSDDKQFKKNWYHRAPDDSLSGIALNIAYENHLVKQDGNEVIVAIIDSEVDIKHEDLKGNIYINKNEIPNNGIDDDKNSYVDDINGWNYLGKQDSTSIYLGNMQHIRTLRMLKRKYSLKTLDTSLIQNLKDRLKLNNAKENWDASIQSGKRILDWAENHRKSYFEAQKRFPSILSDQNYTAAVIDSFIPRNKGDENIINTVKYLFKYHLTLEDINMLIEDSHGQINVSNNIEYNPYSSIDSLPYQLTFTKYGHGMVNVNAHRNAHGTQVSGPIAATRGNQLGVDGFSNNIKLMVLAIEPLGNFRDKDFINAIYYAVDNGAKVINLSTGKNVLEAKQEFEKALEYASNKGVVFVASAGNDGLNLDLPINVSYPTGLIDIKRQLNSFIKVGASGEVIDSTLACSFTNYGKESVDVFAPGINIKVTNGSHKGYISLGGTSLSAALTSGLAALILSNYPSLKASEVKRIILESSTKYDLKVKVGDSLVNFNELSRSGGVINAYEAIKMAEEVSENKK